LNFPHHIVQRYDDVLVLDVRVRSVGLDEPLAITVPENVRTSGNAPAVEFLSAGVWLLAGGTHHSVLIEQGERMVLVEAPLDDERGRALIASARRLVDNKPLNATVATHHHLDQIGGLRVLAGTGATVLISRRAQPWLEAVLQRPLVRRPDPLTALKGGPRIQGVGTLDVLEDPQRPVQVHAVRDSPHANGMLMVWLPKERILIHAEAEPRNGPEATAADIAAGVPSDPVEDAARFATSNLLDNLARLGIAPQRIVSLQTGAKPAADVYRLVGRQPPG
jgi:glyoxylase-like metal-dependent hydrolase (beta-lactamase superfamily II)